MIDRLVIREAKVESEKFLQPVLDPASQILSLRRSTSQNWPFGMDLGARLLMDFDKDWSLAQLDLLIPPGRWQELEINPPEPRRRGGLALNAIPNQRVSCSLPVEALGSYERRQLLLRWGPAEASESIWVSPHVIALLADTLWVGLYIDGF